MGGASMGPPELTEFVVRAAVAVAIAVVVLVAGIAGLIWWLT